MYDRKAAGKRMQECRNRKGVTQQEMGIEIGFSREKVSNLETARNDICMTDAISVCEYLEVGLDILFWSRDISTNDFLTFADTYFKNTKIPKAERKETLKKIINYL